VSWEDASGRAVIYSWSVVHDNDLAPFSAAVPYVVAVVELAEGPKMMTTIVETDPSQLAVDAPVELTFVERDGWAFPVFRPRPVS
jgi:uncharacterized OB-fold protein